jgi:hypothetical protein
MTNSNTGWEDLLRLVFKGGPLDFLAAQAPDPTDKPQITKPTADDIQKMKDLGEQAAQAQDQIEEILGPINRQLKAIRDHMMEPVAGSIDQLEQQLDSSKRELLEKMLNHGIKNVKIPDRAPIEVVTKKDRSLTKKELLRILDKKEGTRVWDALEVTEKHSLKIPPPTSPEG